MRPSSSETAATGWSSTIASSAGRCSCGVASSSERSRRTLSSVGSAGRMGRMLVAVMDSMFGLRGGGAHRADAAYDPLPRTPLRCIACRRAFAHVNEGEQRDDFAPVRAAMLARDAGALVATFAPDAVLLAWQRRPGR